LHSRPALIDHLIVPLMQTIGDLWREGSLRIVHEHLTSVIIRTFLENMRDETGASEWAPALIVTTPAGQRHEFGALIAALTAAAQGWRVTYVGPDLPAEEIASAAQAGRTRAVLLSVVYPPDDRRLMDEFRRLRRLIPDEVVLIVGGRAVAAYSAVLDEIGAVTLPDMKALRERLESLRT
jgi:methanogenic corrinoid protein MtbC1